LECTNFSIAKGGQSRDADSRTLADSLFMQYDDETNKYHDGDSYIQVLQPDYIYIENVKEFKEWGPLVQKKEKISGMPMYDKKGSPIMVPDARFKGKYFELWRKMIERLGYYSDWKLLNSKDFGACQSRLRFFLQFAKEGLPINFPTPTHGKPGSGLLPYRAVKEVLELDNEGISIFNRSQNENVPKRQRKELCEKTLQRIYAGLVKWIANGDETFLSKFRAILKQKTFR
jgi:DNA (cytosine-5)-methyltransferase 1